MSDEELFFAERAANIKAYQNDSIFQSLSMDWLKTAMAHKYAYNFDWLDRPIIQLPPDVFALQEIIWRVKPDLIIETGTARGGSLIFSASMLTLIEYAQATKNNLLLDPKSPKNKVIGIDIDIRDHNRAKIEEHPMFSRIDLIDGSSTDNKVINEVKEIASSYHKVLVFLDSNHTHSHVLEELKLYTPLVSTDSYCVVFDTFIEDMPHNFFEDRAWNVGNNPRTAVRDFLKDNENFVIDTDICTKLQISVARQGFLRRI